MSIYKRNGKYYCRFQINGERHHYLCNGAASIKEAEKIENAFRYKTQQQQNGVISRENKKVKLQALITLYDNNTKINNLSYGKDSYIKHIKAFFNQKTNVWDIKPNKIEDFKTYLKTEQNLSNATINRYLCALSKMYNLGIANKLINYNPVSQITKFREDNHKIRFLTKEEEINLFKSITPATKHLYPLIVCALQTGMRRSEIFNLKWDNIDFAYNFIELLRTKSGKARKIPISNKLLEILNRQKRISDYVFINLGVRG